MDHHGQEGHFPREFIELRATPPRREGPAPDTRPEDALGRYATSLDVATTAVFGTRRRGFEPQEGGRNARRALDDWELAVWVAEALLRHGLGHRGVTP